MWEVGFHCESVKAVAMHSAERLSLAKLGWQLCAKRSISSGSSPGLKTLHKSLSQKSGDCRCNRCIRHQASFQIAFS